MLSLIQHEVVLQHEWITDAELANMLALSQVTPGPISINCATYIGYTVTQSVWGAATATFALVLPSLVIMLCVCYFFAAFKNNAYVMASLSLLRLAVVGLIAAAVLALLNADNFGNYRSVLVGVAAFVALWRWRVHPILLVVIAGLVGLLLF
ncbi:chromate transporter [Bacteroidia bacterium]|nr:chromate transporter [Bacteroidia bacterium]